MVKFLDSVGLGYLWTRILALVKTKQDNLESGKNIKTINGESILGSGDISTKIPVDDSLRLDSDNPVQNKVIAETINKINKELFPLILTASGGGNFKKGTTQTIRIQWKLTQGDDPFVGTVDEFKINESPVDYSLGFLEFSSVTTDQTYNITVKVGDEIITNIVSVKFFNPSCFGIVPDNFDPNALNISTQVPELGMYGKNSYSANNLKLSNQKICYAYPKAFGQLSSIKDGNEFENIDSYTKSELTINGELYLVYLLTYPSTIDNLKQVYS